MAVRNDVSVNWATSPRIITVAAPSTEITIQDLLDTCRELEDDIFNMSYPHLASAAGKENLGGGVKVGITLTLLNAVLAFEARPGPEYIQCRVSGGNIVAIDGYGSDISPIYPTAFTQVVTTASSSATLQEQSDIQFSSFEGGVHVDVLSSYAGTTYPIGTPRQPVNNLVDALQIANERGFSAFHIIGDLTIDTLNFEKFSFYGQNETRTTITILPSANVLNCEFYEASIQGTLDGSCRIKDCIVKNLDYISGIISDSVISGEILLSGDGYFLNCVSGTPGMSPVINFNNSNSYLCVRDYDGSLTLKNKTQPQSTTIDLSSGLITLDSTVSNGLITIRGVGKVIDNSTGSAVVDQSYLVNPQNISSTILNDTLSNYTIPGSIGEAIANAGLTPEQAKQLLMVFINSL